MPVVRAEVIAEIRQLAARRLASIDQLVAAPAEPPGQRPQASCPETFTATDADGQVVGAGTCEHWTGEADSLDLAWGATRRFTLAPHIAGAKGAGAEVAGAKGAGAEVAGTKGAGAAVAGALDQLVGQWRDHLRQLPAAAGDDTAALVHWPSRDIEGVGPLLAHGLWPLTTLAVRVTRKQVAARADAAVPVGIQIRRAGPADLDVVAHLGLAEIRYDAHFGCVVERPGALASMRDYAAPLLALPEPWAWIAERAGAKVGMLLAEPPSAAAWTASMTSRWPAAYLMSMFVAPDERGSGLGTALTEQFHRAVRAAGVEATLLHYEQFNPLSVPFWSQQGYRPLWAAFEARPARSLT